MRVLLAAAVLVLLTSVAAAQAPGETMSFDPESPPSAQEPQTVTVNYRGQVLLADGLSLGMMILGPVGDNEELAGWGVAGYFLGGPIVHVAHGRGVAALQSFGLRAGLPLFGALLGYRLGPHDTACVYAASDRPVDGGFGEGGCGDEGSIVGMMVGAVSGGVTAIVLDAKYLTTYKKQVAAPSWSASIKPTHGGVSIGVAGAF